MKQKVQRNKVQRRYSAQVECTYMKLNCLFLSQIRKDLEDALDMYKFESEIDAIDGMVREKEYMSNVSDIGKDLEHCKELQHKLSEANTDMTVNQKIHKAKEVC